MTTRAEEIAAEGPYKVETFGKNMGTWNSRWVCPWKKGPFVTFGDAEQQCADLNAAYKQGQQDRWISVQERLPEPYQWVLVYSDTGDIGDFPYDIGRLVGKVWKCLGWDYPVTHWALLPPNPEQR